METRSFSPKDELAQWIEHYWFLRTDFAGEFAHEALVPDGTCHLVIDLQQTPLKPTGTHKGERAYVLGNLSRYMSVPGASEAEHCVVGVRFKPAGTLPFLHLPARELTDRVVGVDAIAPRLGSMLSTLADDACGVREMVDRIERTLISIYDPRQAGDRLVESAVETIRASQGACSIRSLAARFEISERTLEKQFLRRVGLTPKEFARIVRFNTAADRMRSASGDSILHVAFESGYYDHAHLAKDFLKIAGVTPSQFVKTMIDIP